MQLKQSQVLEWKKKHFTEEAQAPDEEAIGVEISQFCDWDGIKIMKIFSAALEDANFHKESSIVDKWIEKYLKE